MKKNEIKVGQCYTSQVGNHVTTVRIDSVNSRGGWNATDTASGKRLHIKSPQRLRRAVTAKTAKPATEIVAKPDITPTVEIVTGQPLPADKVAKAGKPKRAKKADAGETKPKRVTMLDAAADVMKAKGKPLHTKDVIQVMATRGLWKSPGGKTPHATLDAAIRREIKTKADAARFTIAGRGLFQFKS